MAFGVFDRLHPGHISFLEQAAQFGDELVVVVARDSIVQELKKKNPAQPQDIRVSRVACVHGVTHAILGDQECGSWNIVAAHKPDIICLGYDQQGIKKDIEIRMSTGLLPQIKVVIARAHEPDTCHSSLFSTML